MSAIRKNAGSGSALNQCGSQPYVRFEKERVGNRYSLSEAGGLAGPPAWAADASDGAPAQAVPDTAVASAAAVATSAAVASAPPEAAAVVVSLAAVAAA